LTIFQTKTTTTTTTSKKAKKDKAKLKKKAKLSELELSDEVNTKDDTALLPVEVALDRLSEKQKTALPNLSGLELDEMRLNREFNFSPTVRPKENPLKTRLSTHRKYDSRYFRSYNSR